MAIVQDLTQPGTNIAAQPDDKPVGFFREDNGNYSTIRLMSFVALIAAIVFGGYTVTHKEAETAGINITFSFLAAAFGPKVVQKFAEEKVALPKNSRTP